MVRHPPEVDGEQEEFRPIRRGACDHAAQQTRRIRCEADLLLGLPARRGEQGFARLTATPGEGTVAGPRIRLAPRTLYHEDWEALPLPQEDRDRGGRVLGDPRRVLERQQTRSQRR